RCAAEDLDVLTQFFTTIRDNDKGKTQDKTFTSTLLYNLIVYSELMKSPWPSTSALEARFTQAKMSSEGERSASCAKFHVGNYDSNDIVYERDQYWNKTATIPRQASVLLLNQARSTDPQ
ncbi:hypothetical protein F444_18412, partial [Phytophthora nicotianae P1976]